MEETNGLHIGQAFAATVLPKYTYAVALGSVAKFYFGSNQAALMGAALGYMIGAGSEITDETKHELIRGIMQRRSDAIQESGSAGSVGGVISSEDLLNYSYNRYDFDGKWGQFIGQPSVNFHAMVYGRPKQGKSILSIQWAKYLSENFGRVLYVASEEGYSVTLQNKVSEFAMNNKNLDFANFRDFEEIKSAVIKGNYRFVFIDSVNFINISPGDVEQIKSENKNTAFITIQQATKGGAFRGSQEFAHNCDIIIQVEAGIASQQGRFSEPTEMAIFEKPEGQKEDKKNAPPAMGGAQMALFEASDFETNF